MDYFIGIDSGGTKTEAVLFDGTGHILYRDMSNGCNAMDIGREEAESRLSGVFRRVLSKAPREVAAAYGGIAGTLVFDDFLLRHVRPLVGVGSLRIEDDGFNLISGTLDADDGCCLIAGTGSSLFARIRGRPLVHIGGLGYLIDTGGSGFELGRDALRMAFRARDGRGEATVLTELLTKELGKDLKDGMEDIYGGGRAFIASLAHTVFEGRRMGDEICGQILDHGAACLAELTHAAAKHFEGWFSVVMGGGLFSSFPEYAEDVRARSTKRARMILAEVPPVYGAAVEAMRDGGLPTDEGFRRRFLEDYSHLKAARLSGR